MRQLTKYDILRSRSLVEYFEIEELGGGIPLRPLTDTQWSQVQTVMATGIKAHGKPGQPSVNMDFDVGDVQRQRYKAQCLAISYGIADGNHWTVADVEQADWPPGTVEKISSIIFRLTGVDFSLGEVRRFRGKPGGSGNSEFVVLRDSVGDTAGRTDDAAVDFSKDSVTDSFEE